MAHFMNGLLNHIHPIRSKLVYIQKLNTVLLGDTQQFCYGFIGNFWVGKTEQKQTMLCLKYNNINFLFTELLYKITFALVIFGTKSAIVWYCSCCSCDIAYHVI